jgi:hypothetical protein
MRENREPLSERIQILLDRGASPSQLDGHQEDMHALGLTLLFAVSGVHARSLPAYPQRYQAINQLLESRKGEIGGEMIEVIKSLTEREASRRIDNGQLRRMLR